MPIRFSAVAMYGLTAMVDLALHEGQGPISAAAMAKRHGIPADCLEQVLNRLRRAGLVTASRGARGGFQLSRPPAQIGASEMIQAVEGRSGRSPRNGGAVDQATWLVVNRIQSAVSTALSSTTLAELAAEARRRHTNHTVQHTYTFYI